ncbi:MAG: hypothetical protein H7Y17_12900 [Chlorobia bacterium]|nr:hypothetical protein [Fimbriimonadaceae bacterium]
MKASFGGAFLMAVLMASPAIHAQAEPIDLSFKDMFRATGRGLSPTPALEAANGKRVRVLGFMARLEEAPKGGFWLCSSPVFQDESGAGSGELPPNAIYVIVRGAGKKPVAYLAGKLAISGVLQIKKEAPRLVLTLDSPKEIAPAKGKGSPRQ